MAGTAAAPAGTASAAAAAAAAVETAGPDKRAERHSVAGPGTQARLHGHFFNVMQVRHRACKQLTCVLQLLQGWLYLVGELRAQCIHTGAPMHHEQVVTQWQAQGCTACYVSHIGVLCQSVQAYAVAERTSQCAGVRLWGRRLLPGRRCGCPRAGRLPGLQGKSNILVLLAIIAGDIAAQSDQGTGRLCREEICCLGFRLRRRLVIWACAKRIRHISVTSPSITLQGSSPGQWPGTL